MTTIWHGLATDRYKLLEAIERNCLCQHDDGGKITKVCEPHRALVEDQRFLDGLAFEVTIASRLVREESAI